MADKKISQLSSASTPLAGTEVLPIVQSSATVKVSVDNLTKGKTVNALAFDTDVAAAGVTLSGTTLAADGTDANIDINITPKGTGEVNLPKVDIDAGAIDGTPIGANSASTGAFTTLSATSDVSFNGGSFVFNDAGADKDARFEGDTDANLLVTDASADKVGVGVASPLAKLHTNGLQRMLSYSSSAPASGSAVVTISRGDYASGAVTGSMLIIVGGYGNNVTGNVTGLFMISGLIGFNDPTVYTLTTIVNSVSAGGSLAVARSGVNYTVTLTNTDVNEPKTLEVSVIVNA